MFKNFLNKKIIIEIACIVGISAIFAFVYNALLPKPFPLSRDIAIVKDSTLDNIINSSDTLNNQAKNDATKIGAQQPAQTEGKQDKPLKDLKQDTAKKISKQAQIDVSKIEIHNINYEQAVKLSQNPKVLFIDARRKDQYDAGHIKGAVNFFAEELTNHLNEIFKIPVDKPIVVYCDGGECELSHELANQLKAFGYSKLFLYLGGWDEWSKLQQK